MYVQNLCFYSRGGSTNYRANTNASWQPLGWLPPASLLPREGIGLIIRGGMKKSSQKLRKMGHVEEIPRVPECDWDCDGWNSYRDKVLFTAYTKVTKNKECVVISSPLKEAILWRCQPKDMGCRKKSEFKLDLPLVANVPQISNTVSAFCTNMSGKGKNHFMVPDFPKVQWNKLLCRESRLCWYNTCQHNIHEFCLHWVHPCV